MAEATIAGKACNRIIIVAFWKSCNNVYVASPTDSGIIGWILCRSPNGVYEVVDFLA